MPTSTDQLFRAITLPQKPLRIVSLVPSQTELLFDLGLADRLIAVTKFCTYPAEAVKDKIKIGGTKMLDMGKIRNLQPDLIIGNKEENERGQIEGLMSDFPVWMSDVTDLSSALAMITAIGKITGTENNAAQMVSEINNGFNQLKPLTGNLKVAYFIWQQPFMVAGKGTFIDHMLQRCGFSNAFGRERYPHVTTNDLLAAQPDVVMLSSEPYPFKQLHIGFFEELLPQAKVVLVNGEMFSWYGSRLLHAAGYFDSLMPEL